MYAEFSEVAFTLLLAIAVEGIIVLAACALGGFLVFRTKRDSHEQLFKLSQPQGTAIIHDDLDEEPEVDAAKQMFERLMPQTQRMRQQMGGDDG